MTGAIAFQLAMLMVAAWFFRSALRDVKKMPGKAVTRIEIELTLLTAGVRRAAIEERLGEISIWVRAKDAAKVETVLSAMLAMGVGLKIKELKWYHRPWAGITWDRVGF